MGMQLSFASLLPDAIICAEGTRFQQAQDVYKHLRFECHKLWPCSKTAFVECVYQPENCTVLAFAACEDTNNEIIPDKETMKKLQRVMEEAKFKTKRRWHLLRRK